MSLWVKSRMASWRMSTAALLAVVAFVALSAACTGTDPTPTAQATAVPTVAATSTSVPAATPTAQATVAPTPTVQATTQPTPAPTSTRVPAPVATPTAQPTRAPAPTPTRVPTATPTVQTVDDLSVVTSTSILADWVRAVGGDRVTVKSLVPRQSDPHNFQPGARDIADVADADVVFVVGLGLEESWLDDLIRNAAKSPETIVELADGINPIPFAEFGGGHDDHDEDEHGDEDHEGHDHDENHEGEDGDEHDEDEHGDEDHEGHDHDEDHEGEGHDEDGDEHHEDEDGHAHDEDEDGDHEGHDHEDEDEHGHDEEEDAHGDDHHGHDHGPNDPHFWFDPERVKIAVETIERELSARAPGLHDEFHDRADAYMEQLDALDAWVVNRVASVPQSARYLVTTHDSFGYFAARYGFEIVGAVIPGGGTEVEPSPSELVELAELIQEHGVAVVFSEEQLSDALTKTLASEAGAMVVGGLYTGSLGAEGSPAATYIGLVRNNAEVIANALTPR